MGKRWVGWENQIVKDYWFTKDYKKCCNLLQHRTTEAIQRQAYHLGMKKPKRTNLIDLTGEIFTNWKVLNRGEDYISPRGEHYTRWWCKCKCGSIKLVRETHLISRKSKSCGHCNDIILGNIYNRWVEPIEFVEDYIDPKSKTRYKRVKCVCHYKGPSCKGTFITRTACLKSGGTKSCGCFNRYLVSGLNSNFWKGGTTDLYIEIRTCTRNLKWRKDVFKRDNYICQKCGDSTGRNLNAHHIKPFATILKEFIDVGFSTLNEAVEYLDFWLLENGITLCSDCHAKLHSLYRKNYTAAKFYSWLKFKILLPIFSDLTNLNDVL